MNVNIIIHIKNRGLGEQINEKWERDIMSCLWQ